MLKLAWRNIWRNRRRTIITMASIFFAVFICTILNSVVKGLWEKMREDTLNTQTGHIQIHLTGYWDNKIVDNYMEMDKSMIARLERLDNVKTVTPRLETGAMASNETQSKGVAIMGISPEKEREKSNLPIRVKQGEYLAETDEGVLIGEGLAEFLEVEVGDTLVLIGQGYHGANAAGLFPIRGLVKLPAIEMSNNLVYMTLPATQKFIDMPDGYSGFLISIEKASMLQETMRACEEIVNSAEADKYEILPWTTTMEELLATEASHTGMVSVIMFVLYLLVAFGIYGTVVMMTNERKREFAMLISLGMSRRKLRRVTLLELVILTLVGVAVALAVVIPVTIFFSANPIQFTGDMADALAEMGMDAALGTMVAPSIYIKQTLYILIFALLTFIYPMRKIRKLKITDNRM